LGTFFIINPTAGRGRCLDIWSNIRKIIPFPHEFEFTKGPGEGESLARKALEQGFTRIIAVGGDGTVSEVVNAMAQSQAQLGIIPAGTGNDFVKSLGIPRDPTAALTVISNGNAQLVDLGKISGRFF